MHRNPTNLVQVPNRNAHFCKNKKEEKGKKSKQKKAKKEEEKKKQSAPPPNPINSPTPYLYLYNNPARAHRDAVTNKQREKTKTRTRTKVGCVAAQQKRGRRPPLVDIPTNNYDTKSPLTENTGSDKNLPDTDPQSPPLHDTRPITKHPNVSAPRIHQSITKAFRILKSLTDSQARWNMKIVICNSNPGANHGKNPTRNNTLTDATQLNST